jgi:phospholipid/cholesterol/gamma-HCH transport system substrate-binding protein
MRRSPSTAAGALTNPVLVGASIVVAIVIGVFLSYNANHGLPFVKTYHLAVRVPDAAELVVGDEVRIGGFRVGQVNGITAMPPRRSRPPYARLDLALDGSVKGIPADTLVRVRPRSLLGAKYVELDPGSGRPLPSGGSLPLGNARTTTELDEAFDVFDAQTRRGLQDTIRGLGDALAGRGPDINRSIVAVRRVLPPLQRVAQTLAEPATDVHGFVDGLARTSAALVPVASTAGDLLGNAATTLRALDAAGPALERSLALLPGTEQTGTRVLRDAAPVLRDLTGITVALQRGTPHLSDTAQRLSGALTAGTRVLPRTPQLTRPLDDTLRALGQIAGDPRAPDSVTQLTTTLELLRPTLDDVLSAQVHCNVAGLFARDTASAVSRGDADGTWLSFQPILRAQQSSHSATPDADLHADVVPTENGTECESGNEPYRPGLVIGHPAGRQPDATELTAPPPGVTARAKAAGLYDPVPGATR